MPLTPEQQQELQELRRLDELEAKFGGKTLGAEAPPAPYASPGETADGGMWDNVKARVSDPNRWKAIAGMQSPAKQDVVSGAPPVAFPAGGAVRAANWIGKAVQGEEMLPAAVRAPEALTKLATMLNVSAPRRVAMGAVQGAVSNPEHPVQGAAIGGGTSLLGEGVGKLLTGGGDVAMQAAVGRRKFTPGVGTTLADEGIIGTREGMTKQVNSKLAQRGQQLHELADEIPGAPINTPELAHTVVGDAAKPMMVPGGAPSSADMPKLSAVRDFGTDMASRGMESGPQALARRIAAGQRSYRGKEDPLQSLLGQLSKGEQVQYSKALKGAHSEATGTSQFADTDKAYGALKRAQSSLAEDISLPRSLFGLASMPANFLPGGSAAASTIGQALTKGGQGVKGLTGPMLRQALLEKVK
jgi:hypothetical protein